MSSLPLTNMLRPQETQQSPQSAIESMLRADIYDKLSIRDQNERSNVFFSLFLFLHATVHK